MSALELAQLLRSDATRDGVVVVDVRDLDRAGGHIRGSVNIHADDFVRNASKHSAEWKGKKVVFHCMYSQQRGPRCARAFAQVASPETQVFVLVGGFRTMAAQPQCKDVLEGFQEMKW